MVRGEHVMTYMTLWPLLLARTGVTYPNSPFFADPGTIR